MTLVPCQGFELHGRDVARFEICLETVLEPLKLSTSAIGTISHLSIERPLWYSDIFHAYYMAGPSKLCFHKESLVATDLTTFKYTGIGNHFLSSGIGYFSQTYQVELIELQCMTYVQCLAAIQQSCEDNSSVDSNLG